MQGLLKKEMGAVITSEQQVYYLHPDTNTENLTHNESVEFTVGEDIKLVFKVVKKLKKNYFKKNFKQGE